METELRNRVASLQEDLENNEATQQDFVQLSQSLQMELERLREAEKEVRWQHEDDVDECPGCKLQFSVTRRKVLQYFVVIVRWFIAFRIAANSLKFLTIFFLNIFYFFSETASIAAESFAQVVCHTRCQAGHAAVWIRYALFATRCLCGTPRPISANAFPTHLINNLQVGLVARWYCDKTT